MLKYDRETIAEYIHKADAGIKLSATESSVYLGVEVAERIFSEMFKNARKMKYGNKGFDFRCPDGAMIDIKGAAPHIAQNGWHFDIKYNTIANFFFCIAFDNNKDVNSKDIKHIWIIPGEMINNKSAIVISESRLEKWRLFESVEMVEEANNIISGWKETGTKQSILPSGARI